jgi:hypothetical protein
MGKLIESLSWEVKKFDRWSPRVKDPDRLEIRNCNSRWNHGTTSPPNILVFFEI